MLALMLTTFATFAQTHLTASVGTNSTNENAAMQYSGHSTSYELGCVTGNTWYTLGVENYTTNDTTLVGFRMQNQFRTLTPQTSLGWYTAVKMNTNWDNRIYFEPGLALTYHYNSHWLVNGTLGTHFESNFHLNGDMPLKVGIGLTWVR